MRRLAKKYLLALFGVTIRQAAFAKKIKLQWRKRDSSPYVRGVYRRMAMSQWSLNDALKITKPCSVLNKRDL